MSLKKIWVVENTDRLVASAAKRSLYSGVAMPHFTHACGLPVGVEEEEWAGSGTLVPIPAGVLAVDFRVRVVWHGVGDGLAVEVSPVEVGLRLLQHACSDRSVIIGPELSAKDAAVRSVL